MSVAQNINRSIGARPNLMWVPIDRINVDRNYQRDIKPHRVRQILAEFEWAKFGALQLAEQEDGTFNVFDGQHRHAAAKLHPDITEVPAVVIRPDSGRGEAEAFLAVNINRTAVTSIERYWAGLEAGDEDMMAVCTVLEEAGCEVVQAMGLGAPNKTHAVGAISRAIKRYGEDAVIGGLQVLRAAWPNDKDALNGTVITALSRLLKNNPTAKRARLVQVLQATDRQGLSADAEAIRKISGGDATTAISKTLVELYNRGRGSSQIFIGTKP